MIRVTRSTMLAITPGGEMPPIFTHLAMHILSFYGFGIYKGDDWLIMAFQILTLDHI